MRDDRPSVFMLSIGQFVRSRGQLSTMEGKEVLSSLQQPAGLKKRHETDNHPDRHADILSVGACRAP
jgi:hypothetical protein